MKDLLHQSLPEFLKSLGSTAPTPGGGAATCVLAATGYSLLAMVCGLSKLDSFLPRIQELSNEALLLGNRDQSTFQDMMKDYKELQKAKKQDGANLEEREAQLQISQTRCAQVSIDLGKNIETGLELFLNVCPSIKKSVFSDYLIGLECLLLALRGSLYHLAINSPPTRKDFHEEIQRWKRLHETYTRHLHSESTDFLSNLQIP